MYKLFDCRHALTKSCSKFLSPIASFKSAWRELFSVSFRFIFTFGRFSFSFQFGVRTSGRYKRWPSVSHRKHFTSLARFSCKKPFARWKFSSVAAVLWHVIGFTKFVLSASSPTYSVRCSCVFINVHVAAVSKLFRLILLPSKNKNAFDGRTLP